MMAFTAQRRQRYDSYSLEGSDGENIDFHGTRAPDFQAESISVTDALGKSQGKLVPLTTGYNLEADGVHQNKSITLQECFYSGEVPIPLPSSRL